MTLLTQGTVMVFAVAGIFLYFPTNRIHAPGRWFFQDTWLDDYVPLVPYFVIPYLAFFPYVLGSLILMWGTPYAAQFYTCFAIAGWSAAVFWYFFPAGILRKRKIAPDFLTRMIVWLYENDHENNTIPSSHVFYAIICSYFFILAFPPFSLAFIVTGFLISISTVLVKQHHLADIVGGVVWAIAAIAIAQFLVA